MLRAAAFIGLMLGPRLAFSQSAAPRPAFEVASIKPDHSSDLRIMIRPFPGGRLTATNVPLRMLITLAYRIQDFQLSGGPAWLTSERYDIEAKAEGNPPFSELVPMIQTLLEDRMQLKFHRETKEMPIYTLVVAKEGKIAESKGECGPPPQAPPPPPEPGKPPSPPCGGFMMGPGRIVANQAPISQLVDLLARLTSHVVLDETGLKGKYDVHLEYTPEQGQFPTPPAGAPPGGPPLPQFDPNGPSLFTALQEQLGLKLESRKGPVEVMVIDHIERPSEN